MLTLITVTSGGLCPFPRTGRAPKTRPLNLAASRRSGPSGSDGPKFDAWFADPYQDPFFEPRTLASWTLSTCCRSTLP
jgi:hypothetical protein